MLQLLRLLTFQKSSSLSSRGGHAQLFFESAIAILQLEESTSAIAIPQLFKEMLLRNRKSATPQSQFFLMYATSSPQLYVELHFRNFRHIFSRGIRSIHERKIRGKKSRATVPLRQVFGFQRNRQL
jgi:hypothetical protein